MGRFLHRTPGGRKPTGVRPRVDWMMTVHTQTGNGRECTLTVHSFMGRTATYQLLDQHRTSSILLCHLCLTLQVWHLASFSQVWDLDFSVITLPYLLSLLGEKSSMEFNVDAVPTPVSLHGFYHVLHQGHTERVWILISRAHVKQYYDRSPRVPSFPSFLSSTGHFIWLFRVRAYVPPHMCLSVHQP